MLKTSKLTKTVYNTNPTHTQPINLYTPSTTSSSGSVCDTEPSSISSSYRSTAGINDDSNQLQQDEPLIIHIDKLKRELAAVKQAKCQLATLYKVKLRYSLITFKYSSVVFFSFRLNVNLILISPLK
jgi:hypothetical protein